MGLRTSPGDCGCCDAPTFNCDPPPNFAACVGDPTGRAVEVDSDVFEWPPGIYDYECSGELLNGNCFLDYTFVEGNNKYLIRLFPSLDGYFGRARSGITGTFGNSISCESNVAGGSSYSSNINDVADRQDFSCNGKTWELVQAGLGEITRISLL